MAAVFAAAVGATVATVERRAAVLDEADRIARSEPVREEFANQIADAYVPHNALSNPEDINRSNDIARRAVRTPEFRDAVVAALPGFYDLIVTGTTGDVYLDPGLVREALAATGNLPPAGLSLHLSSDDVPRLHRSLDVATRAAVVMGIAGAFLIGLGLVLAPNRTQAVTRIGRWLITVGVLTVVIFWALPTLAFLPLGGWVAVLGIVLATGDWLLLPAAVLAVAGIAVVIMGHASETAARKRELAVIPRVAHRRPTRPGIT
jgi:hypothetical protein